MSNEPTGGKTAPLPKVANIPCGSCPYRCDVPSGIWDWSEYQKLLDYDGPTMGQSPALFFCHQKDGHLCAGWLACHDTDHLLALRSHPVDPGAYGYESPVPVFPSGAAACAHGLKNIEQPDKLARRMITKLARKKINA